MKRFAMVAVLFVMACGAKTPLSGGDRPFLMPKTTGLTEQEARTEVMDAGLMGQFKVVNNAECDGVPVGRVCGTEPKAGDKAHKTDQVTILVQSSDAKSKLMPDCTLYADKAAQVCTDHKTEVEKYNTK